MMRRLLLCFVLFALPFTAVPASAQSDTGEIDIIVQDAATKAPVPLARVLLDGPVITSEFTGDNGRVRFEEVPDGIYRARVFARGFQEVTSDAFEVTNGRLITVTVALAVSSNLRTIAAVVSKSTATVSTTAIDQNSAQRRLSDSLADALGKLSGVTVSTSSSDSDATQTVSLEGQDAGQTALSLDGIPLNAPGSAGDLNAIGSDLFTGGRVSFGPQINGLAGGVSFSTLEPTLTWQSEFSASGGSYGKNNFTFGESGSLGKVGIAVMHSYRLMPSLIDGMTFLDTSGLDYSHQGDRQSAGNLVKIRFQPSQSQTLSAMFMENGNSSDLVCARITGLLPCGYGPGNYFDTNFKLYSLTDTALFGETQLQAALYGMHMANTRNELDRYVNGIAQPTGSSSSLNTDGISVNAILPSRDRHTISISGYDTNTSNSFTPLVPAAAPYVFAGQASSYAAVTVNDSVQSSTKLRLNDSLGVSHASNGPGSVLLGVGAQWQPSPSDTLAASYNVGGTAAHIGRFGTLSDPAQMQYDCNGDIAYGNAPGDEPGAGSSASARLSYTRKSRAGLFSGSLYRQVQRDVLLPTEVNGTVLENAGIFPPGYFDQVFGQFVDQCGNALPFTAAGTPQYSYFETPIGNVERVYEGAQISAFYTLGNLVVEPYFDVQVAKALSASVRLNNPYSLTISGSQLPNVPLHREGITLDYKAPHAALEWLADANYTGSNNSQNLPAYATVDAGVDWHLTRGDVVLAASNIFNAYGAAFASSQWAVPYTTLGGTQVATIARPNQPREISATYTVRFGQGVHAGETTRALAGRGERQFGGPAGRGGFGRFFQPLPSAPPADPFAVRSSPNCTADAQKAAQPMLDGLKAYVAQIAALKGANGYPASVPAARIPGLSVTYHPLGSTYALSIALMQASQLRAVFGCATLHMTDVQTAQQHDLFVPPAQGGMFFRPSVTFMPSVGMYFVRRPPQPGRETFRLYRLPAAAPKTPFALHAVSTICPSEMHAAAEPALAQLQAHFASNAPAPAWTITPHASSAGTWYSLEPADIGTIPAILNCGRVAAASQDALAKLGYSGERPPALNYAPALGLYIMTGPGGPGGRGAESGPRPTPTP
jgi:hypothetical protein